MAAKDKKKITVFGASGKVGRLVVEYALQDGYSVVAFIHTHHDFAEHPRLTIATGDVHNSADIESAITDSDIVVSTLGSWGTPTKDIVSSAVNNLIPLMKKHDVTKIITLTGAEARANGDSLGLLHRLSHSAISLFAGKILRDSETHIALLEQSTLDWVIIRSPIMKSGNNHTYTLTQDRPYPWETVTRAAVARSIVNQLRESSYSQRAVFIH